MRSLSRKPGRARLAAWGGFGTVYRTFPWSCYAGDTDHIQRSPHPASNPMEITWMVIFKKG